jgi:hypothetical protein
LLGRDPFALVHREWVATTGLTEWLFEHVGPLERSSHEHSDAVTGCCRNRSATPWTASGAGARPSFVSPRCA